METNPTLRTFLVEWFKSFIGNIIFFILFFLCFTALGQQEPGYTQFMFNKLPINPAYAGGREKLSIRLQYRDQWTQLEGHPRTLNMSIHSPLQKENIAIGGSITYDQLGITTQMKISSAYAYRIKIKPGSKQNMKLSMGLNIGMLVYKAALSEVDPVENGDPTFSETFTKVLPDLGAGVYFSGTNFYSGFSIPNFLPANIRGNALGEDVTNNNTTQRVPHLYMMAGGVIPFGKEGHFKLRPQVMAKGILSKEYAAPMQFDFNASLMMYDIVNVGLTYRTSINNRNTQGEEKLGNAESIDMLLEVWPTKRLLIGYAFDYTLSRLKNDQKGTHEIVLGYELEPRKQKGRAVGCYHF